MDAQTIAALKDELRKDLEALERVEKMMVSKPGVEVKDTKVPLDAIRAEAPSTSAHSLEEVESESASMSLVAVVAKVINEDPNKRWTTQSVLAKLKSMSYTLRAKQPVFSVGQTLRKLVDRGEIRLARKGAGADPNIYKGKIEQLKIQTPPDEIQE